MKLIVGLGNPGIEYQFTPHNMGFLAVDRIAGEHGVEIRNRQCRALTARIQVGDEVGAAGEARDLHELEWHVRCGSWWRSTKLKPESDLIVIQDELDFPLGTLRIHTRRSSAGHNGIESIIGALGTQDFLRIRIGVAPERKVEDGKSYLLSPFRKAQNWHSR